MSVNHRFGDKRSRQSKLQKHRASELGSGKRRKDPSIHATSRPWHTSAPGIKMNVTTLGQIASRDKVAARYLNKMNLSEMAQKKRGIAESEEGRGYDKMGMAMKRGLNASVKTQRRIGAPNQDRIDMWQASISGQIRESKAGRGPRAAPSSIAAGETPYDAMTRMLEGRKKKLPKRPYYVSGINHHYST